MKGSRTGVKVKLGFQNFYVYSAVNPRSGEDLSLVLPYVNTECMNVYLEEMSRKIGNAEVLLVMDCAGWHKAKKLEVPHNIEIFYLPPYSPELNPVERLWQHIKSNTIRNRTFDTINELENVICNFINNFELSDIKSICSFNY